MGETMAFCANCGHQVSDTAVSCPECGHPTGRAGPYAAVGTRTEGTAVTALILGIAGFAVCPLICHILAIIFGNQALKKIRNDPSLQGEGLARAGVILGWIGVALVGIFILFAIIAVVTGSSTSFRTH
jgi:uncharacterized membrane protein YvbJ